MDARKLEKLIGSLPVVRVEIDKRGDVEVYESKRDDSSREACSLEIASDWDQVEVEGCHEVPISVEVAAPILLTIKTAAPFLDPALWGEFSVVTTNLDSRVGPGDPRGWFGTVHELVDLGSQPYKNRLRVEFDHGDDFSEARFNLDECLEGGLTMDEGRVELRAARFFPRLACQKVVNFEAGSVFCALPALAVKASLAVFVTTFVLGYSLRVMYRVWSGGPSGGLSAADELLQAEERQFYDHLKAFGYDPGTQTFAKMLDVLNELADELLVTEVDGAV